MNRFFGVILATYFSFIASDILNPSIGIALASDYKVALVLDKGGKDDKSFNSAAYKGALKAQEELKVSSENKKVYLKYVEATDDNAFETLIRSFASKDFDLIISVGISQSSAMKKIAPQFPNKNFAIVDAEVNANNVRSLLFEEHEGSYLVGALAALSSKSGSLGFIGGMDIPLIRRFELGFISGAKKINPHIKVISNFVGVTGDAWNNPAKGKELALSQYASGADIIFAAAGATGGGLFDAAEEKKKFAIGVDSNQNWIKPGYILTSMMKRVDVAVFSTIQDGFENKFKPGVIRYGLSNQGVDFALDQYNQKLISADAVKKVEKIKSEIISGKIQVPDYYKKK